MKLARSAVNGISRTTPARSAQAQGNQILENGADACVAGEDATSRGAGNTLRPGLYRMIVSIALRLASCGGLDVGLDGSATSNNNRLNNMAKKMPDMPLASLLPNSSGFIVG